MEYPVVTIIADLGFKNEIINTTINFQLSGYVVLSLIVGETEYYSKYTNLNSCRDQNFEIFDGLMKQKIDMADEIYVINDRINDWTKSLIEYAKSKNKPIRYKWVELS